MTNPVSNKTQPIQEFSLDSRARTVIFRQNSQRLTRIEFRLLEHLFHHEGGLVSRPELLRAVWGVQVSVELRTIDSHIVRLRRKLRDLGTQAFIIETVWGLGYRFRWVSSEEITFKRSIGK